MKATKEMISAGAEAARKYMKETGGNSLAVIWNAMWAAQPKEPEQDKERCVGCEACIDTACGRDECPKGWPKAAQPEQEPVAWAMLHDNGDFIDAINPEEHARIEGDYKHALYTTPPQRTWVGLTDEEWLSLECKSVEEIRIGLAIQAKLKEKNI